MNAIPNLFWAFPDQYFMYECDVIERREKAVKVKIKSFLAYPGTVDNHGYEKGFAWLPISALKPYKSKVAQTDFNDCFTIAAWCKVTCTKK